MFSLPIDDVVEPGLYPIVVLNRHTFLLDCFGNRFVVLPDPVTPLFSIFALGSPMAGCDFSILSASAPIGTALPVPD